MWSDAERLCLPSHTGAQREENAPEQARSNGLRCGSKQKVSRSHPFIPPPLSPQQPLPHPGTIKTQQEVGEVSDALQRSFVLCS